MKTKLFAILLLSGMSMFARSHVSIGIGIGVGPAYGYAYAPPPPPPVVRYAPPVPGPGYYWVPGYYSPVGARYVWRAGYWTRPPHRGAHWIAPRYHGGRYYNGYWRR
jgi:hypothetical protein